MKTTPKIEQIIEEKEVLAYNMGGYIYKVAYKQIDKLDDYADQNDLTHWFRTAKSLWRKVKAGILISKVKKADDFIQKTDDTIKAITEQLRKTVGKPSSKAEQDTRAKAKGELILNLETLEQNIYRGMTHIKMWIPTSKEYGSPEDEFKATF